MHETPGSGAIERPIFPLKEVLLPHALMPLRVFEPRYKQMLEDCRSSRRSFGVNLIRSGEEAGETAVPFAVGTEARILETRPQEDDSIMLVVAGARRYRIQEVVSTDPYLTARTAPLDDSAVPEAVPDQQEMERLSRLGGRIVHHAAVVLDRPPEPLPDDTGQLTWLLAGRLDLEAPQRQALLELTSLRRRVRLLNELMERGMAGMEQRASMARQVRVIRQGNGNLFRRRDDGD